eukprot:COSAG01_NODE_49199_length_374_cov_0.832727_1_plen_76_part_00
MDSDEVKQQLCDLLTARVFEIGETVVQQGHRIRKFHVVMEGIVDVIINGISIGQLVGLVTRGRSTRPPPETAPPA